MLWNLVSSDAPVGRLYFETPFHSLEDLVAAINQAGLETPVMGAFIAVEYDPTKQFDPTGVTTNRILAITKSGDIALSFVGAPGVKVSNPPLTKI